MSPDGTIHLPLWRDSEQKAKDDWTFLGSTTRDHVHSYHDYPARMIPQIAQKLLMLYGNTAKTLFDPYCGTGTSLVEGALNGLRVLGTDLNPLARLIAEAKLSTPDCTAINNSVQRFTEFCRLSRSSSPSHEIPKVKNLNYWFQHDVIEQLSAIRLFIRTIEDEAIKAFFSVAFSETVRESSNTRASEFKLFRLPEEKLEHHHPDAFVIMKSKLARNAEGHRAFMRKISPHLPISHSIFCFNTVEGIPDYCIEPNSVDIVITSPPYGDSRTTVAYGQYSRLSSEWLDFELNGDVDKCLMGGSPSGEITRFNCDPLDEAISGINLSDGKRAADVWAFYSDLCASISNVSSVVRSNGYACYVVGNRRVKGITLPTDRAIISFFENNGFYHVATHLRKIPNKRMPLRNSPSNKVGVLDNTMDTEYIIVMRKE